MALPPGVSLLSHRHGSSVVVVVVVVVVEVVVRCLHLVVVGVCLPGGLLTQVPSLVVAKYHAGLVNVNIRVCFPEAPN